jgi:hypothetical protein
VLEVLRGLIRQTGEVLFYQLVDGVDILSSNNVEETNSFLFRLSGRVRFFREERT